MPADGGGGAIAIRAERECPWTAQPDVPWLSIRSGSSGQGPGTVEFTATANGDPVERNGGIMLNGTRAQVNQAAAQCRYTLASSSASFSPGGGSGGVDVRASSALCTWTAASDADWITITAGASGRGSTAVSFTVAPTTGPPRAATLTIAGLAFSVTQSEGCTYAIAPSAYAAGSAGGSASVAVTAGPGCVWTASSGVNWVTLTTASGTGNGVVGITVAPASGPTRSGTLTIAGQPFTVTQSPGCSFEVSPLSHAINAGGGTMTIGVSSAAGCTWTASSNAPWITVTSGASGNGAGTVAFAVAPTTGPTRSATLTVAGQTVTVVQSQGCSYALSPQAHAMPAAGGTGAVAVTSGAGCAWTAASNATWITIASGASGSGSGTVTFTAAATSGPSRLGTITIAGQTVTVTQGQGCTFAISPETRSVPAAGGDGTVAVSSATGCAWTATSDASWITIPSGTPGSGNGSVSYKVAATTGPARTGTMTIAGRTFTINQDGGCTYSISPSTHNLPSAGGSGSFAVSAAGACAWTAAANAPWISITSGPGGTGPGTVQFTAAVNAGGARSGTITAAGQTFTLTQDAGCNPVVSPETITATAAAASHNVTVTTAAGCSWTAASHAPWVAIAAGLSGTGNGTVQLDVQANTGPSRTGTATIAGRTVAVSQEAGCTFTIAPATHAAAVAGGTGTVTVTTSGGCAWTAVSNAPWITVTKGASGSGGETVEFTVQGNATGVVRTGTITIAGQTFTIEQAGV